MRPNARIPNVPADFVKLLEDERFAKADYIELLFDLLAVSPYFDEATLHKFPRQGALKLKELRAILKEANK